MVATSSIKRGLLLLLAAQLTMVSGACSDSDTETPDPGFVRAFKATSPTQLIGGDVAMARVGDFILENDKIRIGLLGAAASPGPGVFGGTLVDADLQRTDSRFRGGYGLDSFAELFPFANLLVPRPGSEQITIVEDGSDGKRAVVRVRAEGVFFLEALSILQGDLLKLVFQNAKVFLTLQTDYILEPGTTYVRMLTKIIRSDPTPDPGKPGCDKEFICDLDCGDAGVVFEPAGGCPVCECAPDATLSMVNFTAPTPVFPALLGTDEKAPGVIAGDFVFFGGQNDLFAPGIGYDEDKAIFDALFKGQDTFTKPINFDFMAATSSTVSYGYFTAGNTADGSDPQVLVPIITSSATAFVTAGINCDPADTDDATCDTVNTWEFERFFAVGKGDVASIADAMYEVRGTPVGIVEGVVLRHNIEPERNGKVFILRDPAPDDPERKWADVQEVVDANFRQTDRPGVLNQIDADVGLDQKEDGAYRATLPAGKYLAIGTNEALTGTSVVQRIVIKVGETTTYHPVVEAPAVLNYQIVDGQGRVLGGKLSVIAVDANGKRLTRDGRRRVYLGEGRLGNGIRHLEKSATGRGAMAIEAGEYDLVVSNGPEYSIHTERITAVPGRELNIAAVLRREVDTSGWIAADLHLHAEASFDSGMKLETRIATAVSEGLEFMVSTDHDVVTDYAPAIRNLNAQHLIKSAIGVEMSTLELGHFTAFPLEYDHLNIPDHGAPDWSCKDGPQLMDELDAHFAIGPDGKRVKGFKNMAHPRDGFIGYVDQLGVNPFDMTRGPELLEANNILLSRSSCAMDAMELFNSKRFDLIRQPTNAEVIIYNRCSARLDAADTLELLDASCPEMTATDGKPLATCAADLRFYECKQRHRRELAFRTIRDILIRTPEEQELNWRFQTDDVTAAEDECRTTTYTDEIPPEAGTLPCIIHPGTYDDWMRWLDKGLAITITGASDSHGHAREAGMPRTFVKSNAQRPDQINAVATAKALRDGHALPTYGPFVSLSVNGRDVGEIATIAGGDTFKAKLKVQTASWFGVDRIEIYVSGLLEGVITLDHGPDKIVDFEDELTLPVPARDGFISVVAMGTRRENLMAPVALDVAFGELQLPRVASLAFATIPVVSTLFTASPVVPDFFPVFPLATTNAVFLDVDGDGKWQPSDTLPAWCPQDCTADEDCPNGQFCGVDCPLVEVPGQPCTETKMVCQVAIEGICRTQPPLESVMTQ